MFRWVFAFVILRISCAQVSCPNLGDFNPDGAFEGWPDPTCPGDSGMDLEFTMYGRLNLIGRTFDRYTVPNIYSPNLDTVFLIHDHLSNKDDPWLSDMMEALTDQYNVMVIVGWGGPEGAEDPDYWRAASDTRTVGAETAEVLMNLWNTEPGNTYDMHLIGHGLGAHVAGHAGRWAIEHDLKLDRVTGLNPSGQHFMNNPNRTVGLYNDCAFSVDVIHTNDVYGSSPTQGGADVHIGNYDFFPNGGVSQPGCATDLCSHNRAHEFFRESITNGCMDSEMRCNNSAQIPDSCDGCGSESGETLCVSMTYYRTRSGSIYNGRYYLTPASTPPYC